MDAIILAAGKGTRIRPFSYTTPKPLLQVQGHPILEWSLLNLRPLADHVIIVAKYLKLQIEAYMREQSIFAHYTIVEQLPEPLGTGHALQICQPHLRSHDFILQNGDDLFGWQAIADLASKDLGLLTAQRYDQSRWGVVVPNPDGSLASLHEKPAEGTYPVPVQVNIGVYKLNSHVFDYDIPLSPRGEYEITDYISHLARDYPVQLVPCDFWFPIGTPEDLKTAQKIDLGALMLAG